MHFESYKHHQNFHPSNSELSDFPLQSPISPVQNSFLFSNNMTTSPDVNGGKKYEINQADLSPQSQVLHAYETPENQNAKPRVNQNVIQIQQQAPLKYDCKDNRLNGTIVPKQINEKIHPQMQDQERFNEVQMLKEHLRKKYANYTDAQLDEIISKFINEYVQKLNKNSFAQQDQEDMEADDDACHTEQSRDSLSTNLDWNDGQEVIKYCQKQKRIQDEKDFRPSQYFGAISVDKLEDGIEDSRIDELFQDCFGINPKPKIKVVKQQTVQVSKPQSKAQNKAVANTGSNQNDQPCKIILNFYNQFQIMNQENFTKGQQAQLSSDYSSQQNFKGHPVSLEDQSSSILNDKTNKNLKNSSNGCQVLHSESQSSQQKPNKNQQQSQENLKKFMSPQEMMKLKHQKQQSENINQESTDFQKCFFKTDDSRQNPLLSQNSSLNKNYQTQINSPQSQANRHIYNQSITSSTNLGLQSQGLSHQLSMGNLTQSQLSDIQMANIQAQSKQSYKSILYKQNPNHHSISSQSSIENKPKQMNKLSYLVAKSLPDGHKIDPTNNNQSHLRINSITTVKTAPKPPQNQTVPLSAKNGRNSKDNCGSDSFCNEASPKLSPKNFVQNYQGTQNQTKGFKLGNHTLTLQHANSTFAPQQKDYDFTATLAEKSVESFRQANQINFQSHDSNNIPSHRGPLTTKTLGRNQSQNFFKTSNTITGAQSFLLASGNSKKKQSQDGYPHKKDQFYQDTEGSQVSPRNLILDTEDASSLGHTSRPQTAINTGINMYMSNASNLGKPPSKLSKGGFLSHNSSVKNLQIASKTLTVNLHTSQNSSRKIHPSHHNQSVQNEVSNHNYPQSTRNANKSQIKFTSSAKNVTSLSKERQNKSNERNRMKSSQIKQAIQQQECDKASLERKRIQYKNQKISHESQAKFFSGNQKQSSEQRPTNGRNHTSSLNKGKSFATTTEYVRSNLQIDNTMANHTTRQDSSSRTMMKINKSLDKISQMFTNAPPSQILNQYPQSTQNNGATKVTEIINQITNYQTMIKKAKLDKENDSQHATASTVHGTRTNSRIKSSQTNASSKTRKDNIQSNIYEGNAKKAVDTYKKYLSSTSNQNGLHSFK